MAAKSQRRASLLQVAAHDIGDPVPQQAGSASGEGDRGQVPSRGVLRGVRALPDAAGRDSRPA